MNLNGLGLKWTPKTEIDTESWNSHQNGSETSMKQVPPQRENYWLNMTEMLTKRGSQNGTCANPAFPTRDERNLKTHAYAEDQIDHETLRDEGGNGRGWRDCAYVIWSSARAGRPPSLWWLWCRLSPAPATNWRWSTAWNSFLAFETENSVVSRRSLMREILHKKRRVCVSIADSLLTMLSNAGFMHSFLNLKVSPVRYS